MNDLSKARVGDNLFYYPSGNWVEVVNIHPEYVYPIKLSNGGSCDFDGRESEDDKNPVYFWSEPRFEIPEPPKRMIQKAVEFWVMYENEKICNVTQNWGLVKEWLDEKRIVTYHTDEIEVEEPGDVE